MFTNSKNSKDGKYHLCKLCKREAATIVRSAYKEKHNAISRKHYEENRDAVILKHKEWKQTNPHLVLAYKAKRRAAKLKAQPSWLTDEHLKQIADTYWLAKDLEAISGEQYHVDHIVPLQGKDVCGLHVPWNLQVLPADINLKKSNK